jgi:hypothetical protein
MRDETHIVTLQQQLRLTETKWDRLAPLHREYHAEQFRSNELIANQNELLDRREALLTAIHEINSQRNEHERFVARQQKALRDKAIGTRYDVFTSNDREFHQAVITDVQAQGIVLDHRDGKARIAVEDLSPEQIAAFGLDRGRAQIARSQEQQRESAFHDFVESALQKNKDSLAAATPIVPSYSQTSVSYPLTQYSKPSLLRQTPQTTTYRVRNQGRARYYYVYPNYYNPYSNQSPTYNYQYRYPR